jgi:hypothetical protein
VFSGELRVDNLGWKPADPKIAVLLGHAAAQVQLLVVGTDAVAGTFTASAAKTDGKYSGDSYATVDFSSFSIPGDYYLFLPSGNLRSYPFRIAEDVYDIAGLAAAKSYYFQRCNHSKALPYASDALGGMGRGGQWVDGACHGTDSAVGPGPGSADNGTLDLHGGWHDAGDYQKTLWGRGVPEMLFAYEMNPGAWKDGVLNLPESGNGVPDLLDEVKWELDFYVRMQRPDGHFMTSTKGKGGTSYSPPSTSDEGRVYFDCTSPSGSGWSGGGVTVTTATGNAVLSLAHAAVVFRAAGQTATGDAYAAAAAKGWTWLNGQSPSGAEKRLKAAAASAVFRMDPANATAKTFADGFAWDTWDGQLPYSATPAEGVVTAGAWHYLLNSSGTPAVATKVRTGLTTGVIDRAFQVSGPYGAIFGDSGNTWEWGWGSNRSQGAYGFNLLMAVKQGVLGSKTAAQVRQRALEHAHFLLGLNPLNMVYLTNMAAYGAEHSSFQPYHGWFSYSGNDGDKGNAQYNGKPTGVDEPLYPYHPLDTQTSTTGPAPGIVVGGPNRDYSCSYDIPKKNWPAYAYRDFSVGCDWSGSACRACAWELTEPMQAYQGPVLALLSLLMTSK